LIAFKNSINVTRFQTMVDFSFFTKGAFRYRFGIGRTNSAGQLTVSYHDVEMIRTQNAQFDLMDYNTRLEECDAKCSPCL